MRIQSSVRFFFLTGRFNERITFFCMDKGLLAEHAVVYETNMLGNRKTKGIQKSTHRFLF